ncbi:MAG: gliding motility-associated C-terminal domain-containing protein [Bacteroidales bacterium]|nr:gliding motility-associated C-terminal domain-containing protein [Bacteroidales bacterium]
MTVEGCNLNAFPASTTVSDLMALSGNLSISDNCSASADLIITNSDSIYGSCPIQIKRIYTITDLCGNKSVEFSQEIIIQDTQPPTITGFLDDSTIEGCDVSAAPPENTVAGLEALAGDLQINDCYPDEDLTVTARDVTTGTCPLIILRTYTVTDPCGNSNSQIIHRINVNDTQAPVVSGSLTTISVEACDVNAQPAETTVAGLEFLDGDLSITDACSSDENISVTHQDTYEGTCPIVIKRTYTLTDLCDNSVDIIHTINIIDTIAPVIVGSIDTTFIENCDLSSAFEADTTIAGLESLPGNLAITDNCNTNEQLKVTHVDVSRYTCPIEITRTYSVSDQCNNTVEFVHILYVNDTIKPEISGLISDMEIEGCNLSAVPAETTVSGLEALDGNLSITDCYPDSLLVVSYIDDSIGICPIQLTRTYTIADPCGNKSVDIVQNVTIIDTQAPVVSGSIMDTNVEGCDITAAPEAVSSVAELENLAGNLTITDNCTSDEKIIITHIDDSTNRCPIVVTRTYTATDVCSNASIDIVHVINVIDTQAPEVTGSITSTAIEGCSVNDAAAASTVAELEALDGDIKITDCQNDTSLVVSYVDEIVGSCPIIVIRKYTVTDPCGNTSAEIVHVIEINDTQAPVVAGSISDLLIEGCDVSASQAETTVAGIEALSGDLTITDCNVDENLIVTHSDISVGTCPIEITRTYTVADPCGNVSVDIIQKIYINDTQAPVITGSIENSTVEICEIGGAFAATTVAEIESLAGNLTITDCHADEDLTVTSKEVSSGICPKVIVRTYTITDPCGNASLEFVHIININDTVAPEVSGSITTSTIEGCDISVAPVVSTVAELESLTGDLNITDACTPSSDLIVTYSDSSSGMCPIVLQRTYTVTDPCGNQSIDIPQTIHIVDIEAPIISGSISPTTIEGCDISLASPAETTVIGLESLLGNLTISDNCSSPEEMSVNNIDNVTGICPIVITRTYTVQDKCGNESQGFDHIIYINDSIAPEAANPPTIYIECIEDVPDPDVSVVVDASDNCDSNLDIAFVRDSTDGLADIRTIIRTYSVTDNCGNQTFVNQFILINGLPHPVDDYYTIDENSQNNIFYVLDNDDIGCDGWGEFVIKIIGQPKYGNASISNNNSPFIPSDDFLTYTPEWNNLINDTIVYSITDKYGDQAMAMVCIEFVANQGLSFPEGFSPNGDGINDLFYIRGLSYYPMNSIVIFDKTGQTVYEAKPYQNDWNGTDMFTGEILSSGTYFFLLDKGDKSTKVKGFIYITREYY